MSSNKPKSGGQKKHGRNNEKCRIYEDHRSKEKNKLPRILQSNGLTAAYYFAGQHGLMKLLRKLVGHDLAKFTPRNSNYAVFKGSVKAPKPDHFKVWYNHQSFVFGLNGRPITKKDGDLVNDAILDTISHIDRPWKLAKMVKALDNLSADLSETYGIDPELSLRYDRFVQSRYTALNAEKEMRTTAQGRMAKINRERATVFQVDGEQVAVEKERTLA